MDLISIVVPCYNEQETVPIFYKKLEEVKQKMPLVEFEYWFIDDGSSDDTLKKMKELHSQNVYQRTKLAHVAVELSWPTLPANQAAQHSCRTKPPNHAALPFNRAVNNRFSLN